MAVVGEQDCSETTARLAEAVGAELARRGAVVLTGGLGGVMEAACRGCRQAGGLSVGILPGEDALAANPYVDIPIVTDMGHARNVILVRSAAGVVAVGGSYGTLSEIAVALKLGKPVVGLSTWELSRPGPFQDPIVRARDPEEAVNRLWELLAGSPGQGGRAAGEP